MVAREPYVYWSKPVAHNVGDPRRAGSNWAVAACSGLSGLGHAVVNSKVDIRPGNHTQHHNARYGLRRPQTAAHATGHGLGAYTPKLQRRARTGAYRVAPVCVNFAPETRRPLARSRGSEGGLATGGFLHYRRRS
jgi:hypothetical protein